MRREARIGRRLRLLAVLALLAAGCSGEGSFSGKVTYQGKEVTGGSLTFVPDSEERNPGKPITVEVGEDGTYHVSGAPSRRLRVSYEAPALPVPEGKELQPGESPPQSPFAGLVPKEPKIEVGSSSSIDVELVSPSGR
jgi:hypothetical protein